ncbi:MAG: hypothetical protein FJW34_26650 [Acidobacteria bacterium]|nr:hypothetical protein [Acidobacteriota bacterium]
MRIPRTLPLWLALALAFAWIGYLHYARQQQADRLAQLEAENRRLEAHSVELTRQLEAIPEGVPPPAREPEAVPPPRQAPARGTQVESQVIVSLRESLGRATATLSELRSRIEVLQVEVEKSAEEGKRLAASEADLKERWASASRVLEAVQAELKTRTERTAHLEGTAERLHQENRGISERLARVTQLTRELEDINRRRETYLTGILRRYRELTEQYRLLAGRADSPGEGAVPAGAELARLQNAIAGAEEDLRQLTALNAQAARLQKKIGSQ